MKILVTGASGFLGFHLTEELLRQHILVDGYDLNPDFRFKAEGLRWVSGDIGNFSLLKELVSEVDGIIHLAGVSRLGDGYLRPYACVQINVGGALNILEAARLKENPPWVILGSTREVQDVRLPTDHVLFQNAKGVYGLSKLCSELLAERYALDYKMRILTLRFSDVYGSPRDNSDRVLPKFILRALKNEEITVSNNGNEHDFTHYTDTIRALSKGVEFLNKQNSLFYETATICTGRATSIPELASLIIEKAHSKSPIKILPASNSHTFRSSQLQNDTDRARKLMGFTSQVSLEEGLSKTIASYRINLNKVASHPVARAQLS